MSRAKRRDECDSDDRRRRCAKGAERSDAILRNVRVYALRSEAELRIRRVI